jgi:hypothetical protein
MTIANAASKSQGPQQRQQPEEQSPRRESTSLDHRYGKIGIVAVAAAARYTGTGKTPAGAPPAAQIDQRFIELAS